MKREEIVNKIKNEGFYLSQIKLGTRRTYPTPKPNDKTINYAKQWWEKEERWCLFSPEFEENRWQICVLTENQYKSILKCLQ